MRRHILKVQVVIAGNGQNDELAVEGVERQEMFGLMSGSLVSVNVHRKRSSD